MLSDNILKLKNNITTIWIAISLSNKANLAEELLKNTNYKIVKNVKNC